MVKNKSFDQWIKVLRAFKRKHGHMHTSILLDKKLYYWCTKLKASLRVYHNEKKKSKHDYALTETQVNLLKLIGFPPPKKICTTATRKKEIREAKENAYKENAAIAYDLAVTENPSNRATHFSECIEVSLTGSDKGENCPWISAGGGYFGYPVKNYGGVRYSLHIASFFKKYNRYPKNDVSHRCHNPRCINADHLVDEPHYLNLQRICCRYNLGWEGQEDYVCPHGKLGIGHTCIPIPKDCQIIGSQGENAVDGRAERRARRARRVSRST